MDTVTAPNAPQMKADSVGFLSSLMSEYNKGMSESISITTPEGRRREARVSYRPRRTATNTITTKTCGTGAGLTMLEDLVTVNSFVKTGNPDLVFDNSYMQRLCGANDVPPDMASRDWLAAASFIGRELMSAMNGLRARLDSELLTAVSTQFGVNAATGNNGVVDIGVINGTTGAKVELGYQLFKRQLFTNRITTPPIIVGAGNFYSFNQSMGWGCCNDGGTDWSQVAAQSGYYYFPDHFTDTIIGANQLVVYAPGSLNLVTFNANVGPYAGSTPTGEKFILADPLVDGLAYDVTVRYVDCNTSGGTYDGSWVIDMGLTYGLYVIPSDAYAAGDILAGNNGVLRYRAVTV
jgi:hypothetical protein